MIHRCSVNPFLLSSLLQSNSHWDEKLKTRSVGPKRIDRSPEFNLEETVEKNSTESIHEIHKE